MKGEYLKRGFLKWAGGLGVEGGRDESDESELFSAPLEIVACYTKSRTPPVSACLMCPNGLLGLLPVAHLSIKFILIVPLKSIF